MILISLIIVICNISYKSSHVICPAKDACLYMREANLPDTPDSLDPHFLFAIASQP